MEFKKIANFLDTTSDDKDLPRFVTKKWIKDGANSKKDNAKLAVPLKYLSTFWRSL